MGFRIKYYIGRIDINTLLLKIFFDNGEVALTILYFRASLKIIIMTAFATIHDF
jgi:hypothetical protein